MKISFNIKINENETEVWQGIEYNALKLQEITILREIHRATFIILQLIYAAKFYSKFRSFASPCHMVSTYSFNNKLYMKRTDGGKDHKVEFS